jgi:hypothetical protein
MSKSIFYIFGISFLLSSYANIPVDVQSVIDNSGANSSELNKVIEHYKSLGDKEKLNAAYFLIKNMKDKYSEYYNYNDKAYKLFHSEKVANIDNRIKFRLEMVKKIDSLSNPKFPPLIVYDKDVITANYLIENIDLAFKVWQEPWSQHFNYKEFCEYILPYRILTEPLSNWRTQFYNKYFWVKDSIKNISDTEELTLYLNDLVGMDFWTEDYLELPFVPVTLLDIAKGGGCNQRYLLMVSILRSMGVPAMIDYAPQHNNTFKDHSWTVYMDSFRKFRPFDGGRARRVLFKKDNPRSAFPANMVVPLADGFASNVYRYTYKICDNSLAAKFKDLSKIPVLFRSPCLENVSKDYVFNKQTIKYKIDSNEVITDSLVYLSVFGYGKSIREADWSIVKNGSVEFNNIGAGIVYLLSTYNGKELVPFSYPILLRDSVNCSILKPDLHNRHKVVLTRKSKMSLQMQGFAESMVGGIFQVSDSAQFENPETIYKITEVPDFLVEKNAISEKKHRYVRYFSPKNSINIAEIQFWSKTDQENERILKGTPIYYLSSDSILSPEPSNAFDGNIRTNFNAPSGSWIGLDLTYPELISKIKYLPRNNFNEIEVNNKYELFYYNFGWQSLGVKIAANQFLEYDSVPSNSLLLLKNLTQGKEERIFTYEKNKQVWW